MTGTFIPPADAPQWSARRLHTGNAAVELYNSRKLAWPGWYAGFVQTLKKSEAPKAEWNDRALHSVDTLVQSVNMQLPEGCWWAVGSSSIWGPPGTVLPDVDALVTTETERIASS